MTMLSVRLSRALARGRAKRPAATRATLLESLLKKRAAAHNSGADDLEALLKEQIRWSLPIQRGED